METLEPESTPVLKPTPVPPKDPIIIHVTDRFAMHNLTVDTIALEPNIRLDDTFGLLYRLGIHVGCANSSMESRIVEGPESSYKTIYCRACHLRVTVPATIKTIHELKDYFGALIKKKRNQWT